MTEAPLISLKQAGKRFSKDFEHSHRSLGRELVSLFLHQKLKAVEGDEGAFWALRGIDVEVSRGEVLGIIGHNGAGKTTMLRMLNGEMSPDEGEISVLGRRSSLIDLTGGFAQSMSGRENIYFRGAHLGYSREFIRDREADILAFAELGDFIDAPIKTYSSGMLMRLGFSVTVFSEPDVLLMDEVLSVGDFMFEQKCMNRINQMRERSATVIVTHSMSTVANFTDRCLLLDRGQPVLIGEPVEAIEAYYKLESKKERQGGRLNRTVRRFTLTELSGDAAEVPSDEPGDNGGNAGSEPPQVELEAQKRAARARAYWRLEETPPAPGAPSGADSGNTAPHSSTEREGADFFTLMPAREGVDRDAHDPALGLGPEDGRLKVVPEPEPPPEGPPEAEPPADGLFEIAGDAADGAAGPGPGDGGDLPEGAPRHVMGSFHWNQDALGDVGAMWCDTSGAELDHLCASDGCRMRISFTAKRPIENLMIGVPMWNGAGEHVTAFSTFGHPIRRQLGEGRHTIDLVVPVLRLNKGAYFAVVAILDGEETLYRGAVGPLIVDMSIEALSWGLLTADYRWALPQKVAEKPRAGVRKIASGWLREVKANEPTDEFIEPGRTGLDPDDLPTLARSNMHEFLRNEEAIRDVRHVWVGPDGEESQAYDSRKQLRLRLEFTLNRDFRRLVVGVPIFSETGKFLMAFGTHGKGLSQKTSAGRHRMELEVEDTRLNRGRYFPAVAVLDFNEFVYRWPTEPLLIERGPAESDWGIVTLDYSWAVAAGDGPMARSGQSLSLRRA